jgi:hypothetical protein
MSEKTTENYEDFSKDMAPAVDTNKKETGTIVSTPRPQTVAAVGVDERGMLSADSLEGQWRLATALANSGVLPDQYKGNPGAVLAGIQMAKELGIPVMVYLNKSANINGRTGLYGDAWKGLVLAKARQCHVSIIQMWFEDIEGKNLTEDGVTWRPGDVYAAKVYMCREFPSLEYTAQFTVDEAKRAGLWGKKVWAPYPEDMLMNRAFGKCAKLVCPEALNGLEGDGITDWEPAPPPSAKGLAADINKGTISGDGEDSIESLKDLHAPRKAKKESKATATN